MPNFAPPDSGSCLAFDFGETRIGAAQGDGRIRIAHPIATITGSNNEEKFARIAALIQQWQPENLSTAQNITAQALTTAHTSQPFQAA